jgi:hypothetical protein
VVNIVAVQSRYALPSAIVTVSVTGLISLVMIVLASLYSYLLNQLVTEEDREVARHGNP